MIKYYIKLPENRTIGPFNNNQVAKLYLNGKITTHEFYRKYPDGDWVKITELPELYNFLQSVKSNKIVVSDLEEDIESKTLMQISLAELAKSNKEDLENEEVPTTENQNQSPSKDIKDGDEAESESESPFVEFDYKSIASPDLMVEATKEVRPESEEIKTEATDTLIKNSKSDKLIDKTVILKRDDLGSMDNVDDDEVIKPEEEIENLPAEIDTNEQTVVFNKNELALISIDVAQTEKDIEKEKSVNSSINSGSRHDIKFDKKEKKKKSKLILISLFLVVVYFTLFDKPVKKDNKLPIRISSSFPTILSVRNEEKSKLFYEQGLQHFKGGRYVDKLKAINSFSKSLSNNFRGNEAIGYLLRLYGEIYLDLKKTPESLRSIHKIVKIVDKKLLIDRNVALGTALFFYHNGKIETALNIVENYLRVDQNSTPTYFAHYLRFLFKANKTSKAQKTYLKIKAVPNKTIEVYLAMTDYLLSLEDYEEARSLLKEGISKFPNSVPIFLRYIVILLEEEDFTGFASKLKTIKILNLERSPVYYSKYLEYMGIQSALQDKPKNANSYFTEALKYNDSIELRSKLSALELGGTAEIEKLLKDSKIINLIDKSKKMFAEKRWSRALENAILAVNISQYYLPAHLWLARLQTDKGYYQEALNTLLNLKRRRPKQLVEIGHALIYTYIKAKKLDDANKEIVTLSTLRKNTTPMYASLLAQYYEKADNTVLALKWLGKSIKINPLNDYDLYLTAKTLMRQRYYKNSKEFLIRAIELDPFNTEYKILNAEILYELSNLDTAIGYLRNELAKSPDNPRILGQIAIYYFRSGKTKEFERTKKKIQGMAIRDAKFYRFLSDAMKLEGKMREVVEYLVEYIKADPSDLEARIELIKHYVESNNYIDARKNIASVIERYDTYPQTYYYLSLIELEGKNYEKAIEYAQKEIFNNPTLIYGHYALGEVYKRKEEYPAAVKHLEVAVSLNPKFIPALFSLGWVKSRMRHYDIARELYLRGLRADPSNWKIHRELGLLYKEIGQSKLAIESFEVYLKLNSLAKDRSTIEAKIKALR
jgi:tetratricopeptide (TPR) repeat protein